MAPCVVDVMRRWYRRPIALLSVVVSPLALAVFTSAVLHDTMLEHRFGSIQAGMTDQQVIVLLGRPDADEPCGSLGGDMLPSCSHELRFQPRMPTITSYVVFIDGRGIVVDKYRYMSP